MTSAFLPVVGVAAPAAVDGSGFTVGVSSVVGTAVAVASFCGVEVADVEAPDVEAPGLAKRPVLWALESLLFTIVSPRTSKRNFWPARPIRRAKRTSPSPASSRTPEDSRSRVETRSGIWRRIKYKQ